MITDNERDALLRAARTRLSQLRDERDALNQSKSYVLLVGVIQEVQLLEGGIAWLWRSKNKT